MHLRELQTNLPWTTHYHHDFRSNPQSHKDFQHTLIHIIKAAGKISTIIDNAEHKGSEFTKEEINPYIADFVICALRMANTKPGGIVDLEAEVISRLEEEKNNIKINYEKNLESIKITNNIKNNVKENSVKEVIPCQIWWDKNLTPFFIKKFNINNKNVECIALNSSCELITYCVTSYSLESFYKTFKFDPSEFLSQKEATSYLAVGQIWKNLKTNEIYWIKELHDNTYEYDTKYASVRNTSVGTLLYKYSTFNSDCEFLFHINSRMVKNKLNK